MCEIRIKLIYSDVPSFNISLKHANSYENVFFELFIIKIIAEFFRKSLIPKTHHFNLNFKLKARRSKVKVK